jgi:hypothetical protein
MPRTKANQLYTFQYNFDKELSESTEKMYAASLNQLARWAEDGVAAKTFPTTIHEVEDLEKHPKETVALIDANTDKRTTKCRLYSAIFYQLGTIDLKTSPLAVYVYAFRKAYYTPEYLKKLEAEGKQPKMD